MWNDRVKFAQAISTLKDGTEYSYSGAIPTDAEEYKKVKWKTGVDAGGSTIDTTTNPHSELTWEKVSIKMTELQTEYDNNDYQRNRKVEYPSIVDQLDDIYHNGIDGWKATIKVTKDKHPKP
jgi:hypothetical protein